MVFAKFSSSNKLDLHIIVGIQTETVFPNHSLDTTHAFPHASRMTSLPVTRARTKLYQLLDEAAESHEPIQITGKRSNAVLVSEDDWRSIQETLYLISIPEMRDSIRKGMAEPLDKSSTKPGW